jgi:hypothetical protein
MRRLSRRASSYICLAADLKTFMTVVLEKSCPYENGPLLKNGFTACTLFQRLDKAFKN